MRPGDRERSSTCLQERGVSVTREMAVLCSGGLDSAILLGDMLREGITVWPLYVRQGYVWEGAEEDHLRDYLDAVQSPGLRALTVLESPMGDLLPDHWASTAVATPALDTPDTEVFLPGRNVLLLSKAILWCHLNGVTAVALGVLASNPFPDASDEFFETFARAVNLGIGGRVAVIRPFARWNKTNVMRNGRALPLERTFSCLNPSADGRHCGACNKCGERQRVFRELGVEDRTTYATELVPTLAQPS
jgi:7-cyano-7-deazaguanine synthase